MAQSSSNRKKPGFAPVVLWFRVARSDLAALETLAFVRGDYAAEQFWSFVQHCRSSTRATASGATVIHHHHRDDSGTPTWYDLVTGPVAAFWQQRSAMLDTDQLSFHTKKAVDVLNNLVKQGVRGIDYDIDAVAVT